MEEGDLPNTDTVRPHGTPSQALIATVISSNSFVQKEVEEKEEKTKWFTVSTFVLPTA